MSKIRLTSLRSLLAIFAALVLTLGSVSSIFAQATPDVSPSAGKGGPNIGDTVVVSDSNGDPMLNLAVTDLVDPDKAVQNPDRGFHWVGVNAVVNNPTDADIDFNAYSITIVDEQGFIANPGFGSRPEDDTTARPDFSESTVPAGGTISGWLFYQVINGATPAWITFNDAFSTQQFVVLANLAGATFEDGDKTTFYDANADENGTVSVDQIITDFQKTDPSVTVDRGMTAVGVLVTIENTGAADFDASSSLFYLVDDLGFQYYPTFAFRSDESMAKYPDLPSDPIAAGSSATGLVLYSIPKDATISYITFQPTYQQFYIVAQPGEGSTVSGETLTPVAVATSDNSSDSGESTPDDNGDTGDTGGQETGDCVGVHDWAQQINDAVSAVNLDVLSSDLADVDPDDLRDVGDGLDNAADDIDDLDAPDVAVDASDATVALFHEYANLLNDAADRIDNGEDPADVEKSLGENPKFTEAITTFSSAVGTLEQTCPNSGLDELLNT
jgi:hypothetical protein